ncbi:MAG: MFS transporter [Nocardioidaceae bacterium]
MATNAEAVDSPRRERLLDRRYLPLTLGAVALVTLGAFENRAVGTALPSLATDLGAISAFGVLNAAPLASYVVSLAIAGLWSDRSGPVPALRAGVLSFGVAQVLVGTAPTVHFVIAGRLLSGFAEGLIDVALMVLVARILPPSLRPRMFSLFAAMWVLPSILGPGVAGVITEYAGWRWVFLAALGVLVPTWILLRHAVHSLRSEAESDETEESASRRAVVPWAIGAATAVFVLTIAGERLESSTTTPGIVIAVAVAALAVCSVRMLPPGSFRAARGLPAVVALRGLVAAAFAGTGAWLPLLLTEVYGFRPTLAGVSLTITGVCWALGSWLQGRDHDLPRPLVLRSGLTAMTVGLAATALLGWTDLPAWVGLSGWAIAGVGMGLTSPSLSLLTLDLSEPTHVGRNSGAAQMAGSLSVAAILAVSGTLVAFAGEDPGRPTFAAILTSGAALALLALLVAGRATAPEPAP